MDLETLQARYGLARGAIADLVIERVALVQTLAHRTDELDRARAKVRELEEFIAAIDHDRQEAS
jgi:hypothetical protein